VNRDTFMHGADSVTSYSVQVILRVKKLSREVILLARRGKVR
jgi:hypothetical protein